MGSRSPDGLLRQLTRTVLEIALDQELTEHLGQDKNGRADSQRGHIRNGTRPKTVLTEATTRAGADRRAAGPGRDVRARRS